MKYKISFILCALILAFPAFSKSPVERQETNTQTQIYAFSNINNLSMMAQANSNSRVIDRIKFGESVQLIGKTSDIETINEVSAPWVLVRRSNGNEGWVFGGHLQENFPNRRRTFERQEPFVNKLDIPIIR